VIVAASTGGCDHDSDAGVNRAPATAVDGAIDHTVEGPAASLFAGTQADGLVTIAVVAQVAHHTLTPAGSVAFFRGLGRTHGVLGSTARLVALLTGAVLLRHDHWDGVLVTAAVVAIALLAASGTGMAEARRMTFLRRAMLTGAGDAQLLSRVEQGPRNAVVLRGLIALLTLMGLVILGAALAT